MAIDWHDPVRVYIEYRAFLLASEDRSTGILITLQLLLLSLFTFSPACTCKLSRLSSSALRWISSRTSWEFVLNLDFEYSIITGKRKPTWTLPVCSSSTRDDQFK